MMTSFILRFKFFILVLVVGVLLGSPLTLVRAQNEQAASLKSQEDNAGAELPKPIIFTEPKEPLEDRLLRKITLDVRDMNVVDVIKFLAQKGEFNTVISSGVDGRT
ncbi:MAG: hypothetical protein HQL15_10225, partial [Candidatus Omnitrophica bacterium]|nr:hypothetical protein [Candidatus Omnitrophota bacterium]